MKLHILGIVMCFCTLSWSVAFANDADKMAGAMNFLRKWEWPEALATAGEEDSVAYDIVEWHRLRAGLGDADDVTGFLERRGDWPGIAWLRRKSEAAIDTLPEDEILEFYEAMPPQSPEGVLSRARALIAKGQQGDAEAELVLAWADHADGAVDPGGIYPAL